MELYKDLNYAAGRLTGTIVRTFDGKAVYIEQFRQEDLVHITYCVTGEVADIKYNELDLTPVPLGYGFTQKYAIYYMRTPVRQDWKQGLRVRTLASKFQEYDPDFETYNSKYYPSNTTRLDQKILGKCIEGRFPTFEQVIQYIGKKGSSIPFSRHFAVRGDGVLLHRNDTVGIVQNKLPILDDKYFYLKEALEESLK